MELRWIANPGTSPLYAAQHVASGPPLRDDALAERIGGAIDALREAAAAAGIGEKVFWNYLLPLSPAFDDSRKLARMVLYRCLDAEASRSDSVGELQQAIDALHSDFADHFPSLADELPLRIGPLREAWEARAPGMLRTIGQLTDPRLIARKADVLLVQPVAGGGGRVSQTYNSVQFEAMLANPHQQLPEVVRLAWMLSQINGDLPMFTESIPQERVSRLAELAMLAPTLAAADHVDLVSFSDELLVEAIELWNAGEGIDDLPATLTTWWNAYVQTRPPWDAAVGELDRLLFA